MPEYQRTWRDWSKEKSTVGAKSATDKTDESASVGFVGSIADVSSQKFGHFAADIECSIPGCPNWGFVVELGDGLATLLCAGHRRQLFLLACTDDGADIRHCRICGRNVFASEEPCRPC